MPTRVLVVDDQQDVLATLLRFLQAGPYDVVGLADFGEARRYIDETPPDLLITDVRLGAFNGLQLALHMRNAKPDAPIIVLSAWDDAILRQETEHMGARYHTKPIHKKELLDAVGAALAGR